MTKEEEVQTLKDFIGTLPTASYLQPMLKSALPMIISDINADLETDLPTWISALRREKVQLETENKELHQKGLALEETNKEARKNYAVLVSLVEQAKIVIRRMKDKLVEAL